MSSLFGDYGYCIECGEKAEEDVGAHTTECSLGAIVRENRQLKEQIEELTGHEWAFVRNIYGDEIIRPGWKRSIYRCVCGAYKYAPTLAPDRYGK